MISSALAGPAVAVVAVMLTVFWAILNGAMVSATPIEQAVIASVGTAFVS